jgi:hypothetical protein
MVQLGGQYQGEESTFEPIPAGDYPMQILASEMAPNSKGNGRFLKLEMEITEGPQAGRKLTERLNLENPNAQAVDIAQRTLRAIIFACGLTTCDDSEQLHMRKMSVRVNVKERNDKPGVMSNEIGGYKPLGSGAPVQNGRASPAPSPSPSPSPSASSAQSNVPPWKRNAA